MSEVMRTGVFGGTFDPIHLGHLLVASEVAAQLTLHRVIFVPAGEPWLKSDRPVSSAGHRLEMVRLATQDNPCFEVSRIEVDRPGPSYSADTMDLLRRQLDSPAELFFLIGSDALAELPRWKEPERLIQLCRLVVFRRPGFPMPPLEPLESAIPGLSRCMSLLEVPALDVSATEIRRRVARGAAIRDLVPEVLERYILDNGLYREG